MKQLFKAIHGKDVGFKKSGEVAVMQRTLNVTAALKELGNLQIGVSKFGEDLSELRVIEKWRELVMSPRFEVSKSEGFQ
jgi:deoxyribose-phosphate aldolase